MLLISLHRQITVTVQSKKQKINIKNERDQRKEKQIGTFFLNSANSLNKSSSGDSLHVRPLDCVWLDDDHSTWHKNAGKN